MTAPRWVLTPAQRKAWKKIVAVADEQRGRAYKSGDKLKLFETLLDCAVSGRNLPDWAREVIRDAYWLSYAGKLKSWEEIFGKPFPGKSQKGSFTNARTVEVWVAVRQRIEKRQTVKDQPIDESLFEEVGRELGIGGHSTVSRLYYQFERSLRRPRKVKP